MLVLVESSHVDDVVVKNVLVQPSTAQPPPRLFLSNTSSIGWTFCAEYDSYMDSDRIPHEDTHSNESQATGRC